MSISPVSGGSELLTATPAQTPPMAQQPPAPARAQPEQEAGAETAMQVQQAVAQIQQFTQALARNLQFSVDEETGKSVVRVIDVQTREIIRQIPSEEAIQIARTLDKVQGLLFNDQA
ncbi:flagellar protein FlaG [Nitrosomonas sp. ANs5]|uniref:flagellar protein FlaG n=1 Tax=Nitrosomonas sp. ANs5 TaxID=3423941 RepID=UPI003D32C2F2